MCYNVQQNLNSDQIQPIAGYW